MFHMIQGLPVYHMLPHALPHFVSLKQTDPSGGSPCKERVQVHVQHPYPCLSPLSPTSFPPDSLPQHPIVWVASPRFRGIFSSPSYHSLDSGKGFFSFSCLGERRQRREKNSNWHIIKPVTTGTMGAQSPWGDSSKHALRIWGGGKVRCDKVREWHGHIYTTKRKIGS